MSSDKGTEEEEEGMEGSGGEVRPARSLMVMMPA